jgi:hypothetical protein
VIFPVPVTLNLFLALEFVFTLGILYAFLVTPLRRSRSAGTLVEPLQAIIYGNIENTAPVSGVAKIKVSGQATKDERIIPGSLTLQIYAEVEKYFTGSI